MCLYKVFIYWSHVGNSWANISCTISFYNHNYIRCNIIYDEHKIKRWIHYSMARIEGSIHFVKRDIFKITAAILKGEFCLMYSVSCIAEKWALVFSHLCLPVFQNLPSSLPKPSIHLQNCILFWPGYDSESHLHYYLLFGISYLNC